MRISYKPLFSIECLHGYFSDRVCRTIAVRPAQTWEPVRQRYQLIFRSSVGGGTVYYAEETEAKVRQMDREAASLAFTLTTTDPLFDMYTDTGSRDESSSSADSVHYFSNREVFDADLYGRPRTLLHPPGAPLGHEPLPLRTSLFTHHFAQPVRNAVVQVTDVDARQPTWETQTPSTDVRAWPIDLRGRPCGRYRLRVNGDVVLDFYLTDMPAVRQWGIVEILPKAWDAPPTFSLALAARETVWRYYIFDQPQGGSSYAGHEVVGVRRRSGGGDSNGDVRFAKKAKPVTLNGRQATIFESMQPLPLAEVPTEDDYLFTFKANGGERGGRSIKLPFAQPSATKLDETSDDVRMCSEIFVYL